jgi:riboflavin kinase/FMN adenylyltransferase
MQSRSEPSGAMHVIEDVRTTTTQFPHLVLTIGSYDGVHLGHRRIIDRVTAWAKGKNGTPAVLTMRPHPRQFFSPEKAPNLLTSDAKKLELLADAGIEAVYFLEFNAETAAMSPLDFVTEILCARCRMKALVVGHDFQFGRGAKGDFALLQGLGPQLGFQAEQAPALIIEGERVSSTLIRERVVQGDLEGIEKLLGRRYSVTGTVVKGRGIGATIGFPTANVRPDHSAVPAQGVYIAEALLNGGRHPAAVNIGIAPTIRHEDLTIEAHLVDYSGDLVGKEIEIVFHRRVRPEKKFGSIAELIEQIARDVEATRDYFREHAPRTSSR